MCLPGCQQAVRHALSRRGFFLRAGATALAASAALPPAATAAPRSFNAVVDLTHTMSAEFPTFFGTPGIEMQRQADFKRDGYNMFWWRLLEHAGTHVDAPIHFSAQGATADQVPAESLVAPLAVIDVTEQAARDPDYLLAREDVARWERAHGELPVGSCVAMHSGWARVLATDPAKFSGRDVSGTFHFPGIAPATAEWLIADRRVAGLAVDTLSLDHGPSKDFKTHYAWLPTGRWGIENVANLDRVPPSGATLVVGLAKIKDATGGAARVLALV
jgi:kynurenine formamidase